MQWVLSAYRAVQLRATLWKLKEVNQSLKEKIIPRHASILVALIVLLTADVPKLVTSTPATPGGTPPVRVSTSPVPKIDLTWPTTKQVPAGLELRDDSDRSLTEVIASFDNPAAVRRQFMA